MLLGSGLFLTACGGDDNKGDNSTTSPNVNVDINNIKNPVVNTPKPYVIENFDEEYFTVPNAEKGVVMTYKMKGIKGSLVTTLGSALPSFLIILAVAMVFTNFRDNLVVERIFKGIRPAVVALIAAPLYKMAKSAGVTWKTIFIPIVAVLLIWLAGISPIWVVISAIAGGVLYGMLKARRLSKSI